MTKRVILALSVVALSLVVIAGSAVYARTMMGMSGNGGNHGISEEQYENMNRMTIEQCESIMGTSHDADHRSMMDSDHMTGMHGTGNGTGGCH